MPRGIYKKTEEHKRKIGEAHKGMKRPPFSKETRRKMREAHKGEKCYFWKGGRTQLQNLIRKSYKYRQWRSDVFTRDDFTCQECGLRGVDLEADHHLKKFSVILDEYNIKTLDEAFVCEELWNINNGRTLCKKCHRIGHKK